MTPYTPCSHVWMLRDLDAADDDIICAACGVDYRYEGWNVAEIVNAQAELREARSSFVECACRGTIAPEGTHGLETCEYTETDDQGPDECDIEAFNRHRADKP